MTDPKLIADRYIALWNETDPAVRRRLLAEDWLEQASYVDLDGPLLLAKDREHGFRFDGSFMHPCDAALWG